MKSGSRRCGMPRHVPRQCRTRSRSVMTLVCIGMVVLAARSFFLGSAGGPRPDIWVSKAKSAAGMLIGTRQAFTAKLPLYDSLVVYDVSDADSSEQKVKNLPLGIDEGGVPILMIAGCRPRMLRRALLSLLRCYKVDPSIILVSIDEQTTCRGGAQTVAKAFGVRTVIRTNQQYFESGSKRIARHYKWSLEQAMAVLEPSAKGIVVVEEDLLFSVDFYSYMLDSMRIIGESSKSSDIPWTASGWNDNGYAGRVQDVSSVRLSHFFPGLGWLLTRKIWDDSLAKAWPNDHWDHWIRENSPMQGRPVIIPEVNRVFHAGVNGIFMNVQMHMKLFHYIAPYGGLNGVDFDMSKVASSSHYKQSLIHRIASATPVSSVWQLFTNVDPNFSPLQSELEQEGQKPLGAPLSGGDFVIWAGAGELSTWCSYFGLWPLSDASGYRSAFSGVIELYWNLPTAAISNEGKSLPRGKGLHIYLLAVDNDIAADVAEISTDHSAARSSPLNAALLGKKAGQMIKKQESSSRYDWPADGGYHRVRGYIRPHIPRIIHQTWKTSDRSDWTETIKLSVDSWRQMNPYYEMKFWDDDAADTFVSEHFPEYRLAYAKSPVIQKADLFRYLVLLKEGGVYADTDVLCKVPVDLWPTIDFSHMNIVHRAKTSSSPVTFGGELASVLSLPKMSQPLRLLVGIEIDDFDAQIKPKEDSHAGSIDSPCRSREVFCQWAMAAAQGHPAVKRVVETVVENIDSAYNSELLKAWKDTGDKRSVVSETVFTTGPCAWTRAIEYWLNKTHGLSWRSLRGGEVDHVIGDMKLFGERSMHDELVEHKFAGSWKL